MNVCLLIKDCEIESTKGLVKLVTDKKELTLPVEVEYNGETTSRYLRVRFCEKENKIKVDVI